MEILAYRTLHLLALRFGRMGKVSAFLGNLAVMYKEPPPSELPEEAVLCVPLILKLKKSGAGGD